MTNVPTDLREVWTDLYKLFDKHFLMNLDDQEDWKKYWDDASAIVEKWHYMPCLIDFVSTIAEFIVKMRKRKEKAVEGQ